MQERSQFWDVLMLLGRAWQRVTVFAIGDAQAKRYAREIADECWPEAEDVVFWRVTPMATTVGG